jgi:hypothetical protein
MSKYGWLEPIFYLLGVNLVVASWLLMREVLFQPRRIRSVLIVLSCFVAVLFLLQIATGYYFAFDAGEITAYTAGVMAYVASMILVVSAKRMASSLNRIVGIFGLVMMVLTAAFSVDYLFVLLSALGLIAIIHSFRAGFHRPFTTAS